MPVSSSNSDNKYVVQSLAVILSLQHVRFRMEYRDAIANSFTPKMIEAEHHAEASSCSYNSLSFRKYTFVLIRLTTSLGFKTVQTQEGCISSLQDLLSARESSLHGMNCKLNQDFMELKNDGIYTNQVLRKCNINFKNDEGEAKRAGVYWKEAYMSRKLLQWLLMVQNIQLTKDPIQHDNMGR